ncbi:restriction endonuclease subunit S [Aliiglaciecola sp. NS0011-25]|uniref:restriction endonuclease subunit S n=1 Tax=Aliiglaciecola sp. NS0011-25 TaxID=3127654 RepID=UPI00310A1A5C
MESNCTIYTVEECVEQGFLAKPLDGNHGGIHPKSSDFIESGIPFVMASDLKNGGVDTHNCKFISIEQSKTLRKGFAKEGDILLSHKATIGRTAIVGEIDSDYIVLTPQVTYYRVLNKSKINPKYLKYYFDSIEFQNLFEQWAGGGSTRLYLGITGQMKLPIKLPPINTQNWIVSNIDSFDSKLALNRQTNQTLEQMAQALFKSWFVDFDPVIDNALAAGTAIPDQLQHRVEIRKKAQALQKQNPKIKPLPEATQRLFPNEFEHCGDNTLGTYGWIPKGWKKVSLKSFGKVVTGKTPPKKVDNAYSNIGVPFITPTDVDTDVFALNTARKLTDDGVFAVKNNVIEAGSICVTCIGSQMGKTVIAPSHSVTNQQLNSIVVGSEFCRNYLFVNLRLRRDELFNLGSSGSTMPILNKSSFENLSILKPCDDSLRSFSQITENYLSKVLLAAQQNEKLVSIRDRLLPKLISGELQLAN